MAMEATPNINKHHVCETYKTAGSKPEDRTGVPVLHDRIPLPRNDCVMSTWCKPLSLRSTCFVPTSLVAVHMFCSQHWVNMHTHSAASGRCT
eukprot:5957629-Amphidinium_carterae.2